MSQIGAANLWQFYTKGMNCEVDKYFKNGGSTQKVAEVFGEKMPLLKKEVTNELIASQVIIQSISRHFCVAKLAFLATVLVSVYHLFIKSASLIELKLRESCVELTDHEVLCHILASVFFLTNTYCTVKACIKVFFHLSYERRLLIETILVPLSLLRKIKTGEIETQRNIDVLPYPANADDESAFLALESVIKGCEGASVLQTHHWNVIEDVEFQLNSQLRNQGFVCIRLKDRSKLQYLTILSIYLYFICIDIQMFFQIYIYRVGNHTFQECKQILDDDFTRLWFNLAVYFIAIALVYIVTGNSGEKILRIRERKLNAILRVYHLLESVVVAHEKV